jgi:dihydrofolate reductase
MRKIIAAINMTLDGICDHTAGIPDEEIHQHYAELLGDADVILYGRTTYQLMQFWQNLAENPSGEKTMDDFAMAMDIVPKLVFSHTLQNTDPIIIGWHSATLSTKSLEKTVMELKQQAGKEVFIGSRSLINQLTKLNLIDEFQICVHPVIAGGGLPLFENTNPRTLLKLTKTKTFRGGAIILYYEQKK